MATPILVNEIKATGIVLNNDVYVWRGGDTSFLYLYYSSSSVNLEGTDSSDHIVSIGYRSDSKANVEAGDGDDTFMMYGNTTVRFYGGSGNVMIMRL